MGCDFVEIKEIIFIDYLCLSPTSALWEGPGSLWDPPGEDAGDVRLGIHSAVTEMQSLRLSDTMW